MTTLNNIENSRLSAPLFNIQYPNGGRGMFSLREPFKDMPTEIWPTEIREPSPRKLTPVVVQPTNLNNEQIPPIEEKPVEPIRIQTRQKSKRNAAVQCSLLTPNTRHDIAVQTKIDRRQPVAKQIIDDNDITPRYHRQKKLQPIEQYEKVYEIWDVEPRPVRTIPMDQTIRRKEIPREKYIKHRKSIIEYPDEDDFESDYDDNEQILYARQPQKAIKKTYLPPNVQMICIRDEPNRVSY